MEHRALVFVLVWLSILPCAARPAAGGPRLQGTFVFDSRPALGRGSSNPGVVLAGGKILVTGGQDGTAPLDRTLVIDPASGAVTEAGRLPAPVWAHQTVALAGRVYVLGGFAGPSLDRPRPSAVVTSGDPSGNRFRSEPSMPHPRARFAAASVGGRLWAIGGTSVGGRPTDAVDVFDPATRTWSAGPGLPYPIDRCQAAALGGRLVVTGGQDAAGRTLASTLVLDTATGRWTDGPAMNVARKNHAVAVWRDTVVVAGGWHDMGPRPVMLASVEVLDPPANRWADTGQLPAGRDGVRAVAVGDELVIVGGFDGKLPLAAVERGRFVEASPWRVDSRLGFALAYYSDDEEREGAIARSQGLFPDDRADIANIKLEGFLSLGFPVPRRPDPASQAFYIKLFEPPPGIDAVTPARRLLETFMVDRTSRAFEVEKRLLASPGVSIKKGLIAPAATPPQAPGAPFLPMRAPVGLARAAGVTQQRYFEDHLPFSTLYVEPPPGRPDDDADRCAFRTGSAVLSIVAQLEDVYARTLHEVTGMDTDRHRYFMELPRRLPIGTGQRVVVFRLLRTPLVFANWRDCPMPQNAGHTFLSGLQLILRTEYRARRAIESPAALVPGSAEFDREFEPTGAHMFEIGSVVRR